MGEVAIRTNPDYDLGVGSSNLFGHAKINNKISKLWHNKSGVTCGHLLRGSEMTALLLAVILAGQLGQNDWCSYHRKAKYCFVIT
jgi:hypothetical protein